MVCPQGILDTTEQIICQDYDECDDSPCHEHASCTNTVGSYNCACNDGWSGDGFTQCVDVHECDQGETACADVGATCHNEVGSYTCSCDPGYQGNGSICNPIACIGITSGLGYGSECNGLVTGETCTQTCTTGYVNTNHAASGNMVCSEGIVNSQEQIVCIPRICEGVPSGSGLSTECSALVTDGNCTQTCAEGYSNTGTGSGIITCPSGIVDTSDQVVCTADTCVGFTTGEGYGTECDTLVTDGHCTQTCTQGYSNVGGSGLMTCPGGVLNSTEQIICIDVNECDQSPCAEHATCTNIAGSFTCDCNAGWSGNGHVCSDINECDGTHSCAEVGSVCINWDGFYECNCQNGYTGNGYNCVADLCNGVLTGPEYNDDCDELVTDGTCTQNCNIGYSNVGGSGMMTCEDAVLNFEEQVICSADPCPGVTIGDGYSNACDALVTDGACLQACTSGFSNIGGSGLMTCPQGILDTTQQIVCVDIDECELYPCDENAVCLNTAGSFICTCKEGWSGDGYQCVDVDECIDGSHTCAATGSTCTNTDGAFECMCSMGYSGNGTLCDANQCAGVPLDTGYGTTECDYLVTDGTCTQTCADGYVNIGGNGSLTCPGGVLSTTEQIICIDYDECQDSPCHENAACTNSAGSFTCECNAGYSGDGFSSCTDVHECNIGGDVCSDVGATCINSIGSYECVCDVGYSGDGTLCTANPCDGVTSGAGYGSECESLVTDATCTQTCAAGYSNNGGSGVMTCVGGVLDVSEQVMCIPDHCEGITSGPGYGSECDGLVTDTTCTQTCMTGYSNVGGTGMMTCIGGVLNTNEQVICTADTCSNNIPSGSGYGTECATLVTDTSCVQTCAAGFLSSGGTGVLSCPQGMLNTSQQIICTAQLCDSFIPAGEGYGSECVGLVAGGACVQTCASGFASNGVDAGQYSCPDGILTGTPLTCTDENECLNSPCAEFSTCTNIVGSYQCVCDEGWQGDGYTECSDINECEFGNHSCDPIGASCVNVAGSYGCNCNPGYSGNGTYCQADMCTGVPSGAGYGSQCDQLVTDGTCTQTCTIGYSNIGGSGVMLCPDGMLDVNQYIICVADICSDDITSGPGYNTECDTLVTDGSCTQTCAAGYFNSGGSGVMNCPSGILDTQEQIVCTGYVNIS